MKVNKNIKNNEILLTDDFSSSEKQKYINIESFLISNLY